MKRDGYVTHPYLSVPCSAGTLFVFKHMDDLHFCHEAQFADGVGRSPGHRFAFVFRWLQLERSVYTNVEKKHGMKLNAEQSKRERERQRERRSKRTKQR